MSKAQGDGFKTYTDINLNQYRVRLDEKIKKLVDEHEKWIRVNDEFKILCVCGNEVKNENGSWKWDGWKITGQYYRVSLYEKENVKIIDNRICAIGLPVLHFTTEDKAQANLFYQRCTAEAKI